MTPLELGKQRAEELGLRMKFSMSTGGAYYGSGVGAGCVGGSGSSGGDYVYSADDIHKLLCEGVEVFQESRDKYDYDKTWWGEDKKQVEKMSRIEKSALLIGIRPIKQDSFADIVKGLADTELRLGTVNDGTFLHGHLEGLIRRAKKLLEGGE